MNYEEGFVGKKFTQNGYIWKKKMKGMSNNGTHAKCQCMETKGVCVKLYINRMCLNFERSQKELG